MAETTTSTTGDAAIISLIPLFPPAFASSVRSQQKKNQHQQFLTQTLSVKVNTQLRASLPLRLG